MKKVSVIILNWNGEALLKKFLPSVVACTSPDLADVIIADNGSTDQSLSLLRSDFPTVQLILLEKNFGFAEGYNQAIKQIQTPYVVLLNSDVEVTPGWLDPLVAELDNNPEIAAVQPKILSWDKKDTFEYAGACGGFMDLLGYPFCRGRLLHVVEKDNGQYDSPSDVLWVSGACMLIRRDVYIGVGGLDIAFFAHQEEIDMCWRMRSRGYRMRCIPSSVVYHVGGGTLQAESPRKTFLNFRNNLLMLYKNLPASKFNQVMRIRFYLDYLAAFKFALTGHFSNAKAVYKARQEFYCLMYSYKNIRRANREKTFLWDIPELLPASLLVQFYVKGNRTFSGLNYFKLRK